MKNSAGIFFVIGTLFLMSESVKIVAVFFYIGSFFSCLSYIVNSSLDGHAAQEESYKIGATNRFNRSIRRKSQHKHDDSHLITPVAGIIIAEGLSHSDDTTSLGFDDDNSSYTIDDDISSISNSSMDLEIMVTNPASGLPMINGIGGVDVGGNVFGSDSMSDMYNSMGSDSMLSDDLSSSISSFDSFDSSSDIGCDDSFNSFDDSCSSMSDDW